MANVITVVGDNFVLNGRSSAPLGISSLNIAGDAVNLRYSPGSVSWSLDYKNTTVDGATFPSVQELFDSLASFSKGGGGTGEGVPTGTERDVLTYDSEGNLVAKPPGWRQFSDLPTPPPFLNGVFIGTAFNSDGSALFGFLEMALDGVNSIIIPNAFPVYNPGIIGTGGGTLPVADGIDDEDAVNVGQLNIRVPVPPTSGTFVLRSVDGVTSWVAE